MKVLLDNCVPKKFGRHLTGHEVMHASEAGWSALTNGMLLKAAKEGGFEALLTVDKSLRHQQNKSDLPLPVVLVDVVRNKEAHLVAVLPRIEAILNQGLQRRVYIVQRD